MKIRFPAADGKPETYHLAGEPISIQKPKAPFNRVAFAAAHVVADPLSSTGALDWDKTLGFRHYLLDQGFDIAEAMDTSQRGMGLDWPLAHELIARSLKSAGPEASRARRGHWDPDRLCFSQIGWIQMPSAEHASASTRWLA